MKKLLYLLFILSTIACQHGIISTKAVYVPVVTTPHNSGLGDPLATAFEKVNAGFVDVYTNLYDTTPLVTAIIDPDVAALIETQIQTALSSYGGGGGGATDTYTLSGRVGETGFPVAGDSLIINTGFIAHPSIFYFGRDGNVQQQHVDNTQTDGFKFNQATGTITVRPVFGANEQIIIKAVEPIVDHQLVAEGGSGGGGSPSDTPLLDSLLAVWESDEVSGTTLTDALGVNNGTTTATPNQTTAKLGKSKLYNGLSYSVIPNNASLIPDGDKFSVSLWFYLTQLPSTAGHYMCLVRCRDAQSPYLAVNIYLQATNNIAAYFTNSTGTVFEYETAINAVSVGQWYHLDAVNYGNGKDAKIFLNNVDVTSYHPTPFSGSLLQFDSVIYIGNQNDEDEFGIVGYIDQVLLYKQALTGGLAATDDDIDLLNNSGAGKIYPFN